MSHVLQGRIRRVHQDVAVACLVESILVDLESFEIGSNGLLVLTRLYLGFGPGHDVTKLIDKVDLLDPGGPQHIEQLRLRLIRVWVQILQLIHQGYDIFQIIFPDRRIQVGKTGVDLAPVRADPIHQLFRRVEAVRVLFDDLGQQQDSLVVAFLFDKLLHFRQAFPRQLFRPTASLDADRSNQTEDESQENDFSLYRRRIQRCLCPQNRFEDFGLLYYSLYHYRRKIPGHVQRNVETTDSLASG